MKYVASLYIIFGSKYNALVSREAEVMKLRRVPFAINFTSITAKLHQQNWEIFDILLMVNVAGEQFQIGALKSDAGRWTIGEVEGWNFGAVAKFISPQNILKLLNS